VLGEQLLDVGRCDITDRLVPDVGIDLVFCGAFVSVIGRAFHFRILVHAQPILHALFQWFAGFIGVGKHGSSYLYIFFACIYTFFM